MLQTFRVYYILFWWISLLSGIDMAAQTGTEFWFVAPEVTSGHSDRPIFLRVSTYSDSATITISQPANYLFTNRTVTLGPNQTQSIDLTSDISYIENTPANTVNDYGIYIQSTSDISAYYEVKSNGYNTDIFALKAQNAMGNHFMIPAQSYWHNSASYNPIPYSTFEIVASEDGTVVTIIPSKDIVGHNADTAFSITLNKGQTYSAKATSRSATNHLGGSEVTSTKPIAITISDDSGYNWYYGSCADLMGDQLIPISIIGQEYIVIKGFFVHPWGFARNDRIYVMAVENNTDIFLDGSGTAAATLNKGEQYEISLSNPNIHILGSKDIYVLQISGFGCEVGAAVLPSLYCTGSEQVSFTRSKSEDFYLMLLVPAGGQGSFKINGNKNLVSASDFTSVSGTAGQWKAARIYFSNTDIVTGNNYIITNSNKAFHAAIINGGAMTGCMFGYFSDFGSVKTDPIYHY